MPEYQQFSPSNPSARRTAQQSQWRLRPQESEAFPRASGSFLLRSSNERIPDLRTIAGSILSSASVLSHSRNRLSRECFSTERIKTERKVLHPFLHYQARYRIPIRDHDTCATIFPSASQRCNHAITLIRNTTEIFLTSNDLFTFRTVSVLFRLKSFRYSSVLRKNNADKLDSTVRRP